MKKLSMSKLSRSVLNGKTAKPSKIPYNKADGDLLKRLMVDTLRRLEVDTLQLAAMRATAYLEDDVSRRARKKNCEIPGCPNTSDLGKFVGNFCAPCYNYIVGKSTGSDFNPSQAWKNEKVKANFRVISAVFCGDYVGHEIARRIILGSRIRQGIRGMDD